MYKTVLLLGLVLLGTLLIGTAFADEGYTFVSPEAEACFYSGNFPSCWLPEYQTPPCTPEIDPQCG
ncbi:hypothetical protein D6783_01370 [Candidatus Woesearchaeota archaeon]|nr:MAG: hypothetical protein D6783_01370 [Candidatus Woesearchaeota archaeon]